VPKSSGAISHVNVELKLNVSEISITRVDDDDGDYYYDDGDRDRGNL
jgi:hypothetical protein